MTSKLSRIGLLASVGFVLSTLSACNMLEGKEKTAEEQPAPVATAPQPEPAHTITLAEAATFRLPLPSPRHRDSSLLQVASIDPKQSIEMLKTGKTAQELAGTFLKYDTALTVAEESKLKTPKEMRRVLAQLRFKTPDEMETGWHTMRALVASKDNAFVKGVHSEVIAKGREKFLMLISRDDDYVNTIPGAGSAAQAVIAAVTLDNIRMQTISAKFISTATRFQKTKYGMLTPLFEEPATQIASTESRSLMSDVKTTLAALSPISEAQAEDDAPTTMEHILALAARKIVTDTMSGAPLSVVDKQAEHCLTWTQLNLNQCLAAAHFPSEEAWCTGKHGVDDVRKCWAVVLPPSLPTPH